MTSTVDQDESGPIERTTVYEKLKEKPVGWDDVHEDDIRLVNDVFLQLARINGRRANLVMEVLTFSTYYNVTAHITTGMILLHDMQKVKNYNNVLIKKVYYDIEANLCVAQVEKMSAHNRTLDSDITVTKAIPNGRPKKRRLADFFGLGD